MYVKEVIELSELKSYHALNTKIENKKSILQFLPKKLEYLSSCKKIRYNEKNLKTSYIIDLTHSLILKYYFKKDNRFNLLATILKEKYGSLYNYYINYLIDNKVIHLISNYNIGRNARVYELSKDILEDDILRYKNVDTILLKKYKSKLNMLSEGYTNSLIDLDVKSKLVNDLYRVSIEFDRSIFYLDTLKDLDGSIYNKNKYSVESIDDGHIFYHFDSYGRMHTNFTILKSFIRKNCLLLDGKETYEIDIKNSQPLFLTKLLIDSKSKWINSSELELFKILTKNGKFYDYIMQEFNINNRSLVKEYTYKVLFGRNRNNSKADKVFSKLFPTIYNFIKLYKKEKGDYKALAYDLQKAESSLIFNTIIKTIMYDNPNITIITVHDSIIVPIEYKEYVSDIFNKKLIEAIGI